MLKKANEPLYVLRELRKLGELDLVAETDQLPALAELEADHPYFWWKGTLRTASTRAQIDEVFEFVVGDCDLEIEDVTPAAASVVEAAAPVADRTAQPVVAAPSLVPASPAPVAEPRRKPLEPGAAGRTKPAATTTRIELERIDRVVNMVGELVISQAMLGQIVQDLPGRSGRPANRRSSTKSCIIRAS